uniref:Uncharacterized protein n=1 Tax=Arundo donax TaxID=35708 RepID=A0A0A9GTW1_ARUDO
MTHHDTEFFAGIKLNTSNARPSSCTVMYPFIITVQDTTLRAGI